MPLWPIKIFAKVKNVGIFKTMLLSFAWAYITTLIPIFDVSHKLVLQNTSIILLFATKFSFMLLLCIIFDARDIAVDKMNGLHSIATAFSPSKLHVLVIVVFLFHLITAFMFCFYTSTLYHALSFIGIGIIFLAVFTYGSKKRGYFFYYFIVDGLMIISAIGTYIAELYNK
jgi:4-hydroxybenzoate polyprenyltransferase